MTNEATNSDQPYDPDAPPESTFITRFIGRLVASVMVTADNLQELIRDGRLSAKAGEQITKYWGDRKQSPVWFLEAHGISVVRSDGEPFRQSDIIALTGKDGKWLGKGMAPDAFAAAYRGHGVTASYLQVGTPTSAVGRIFDFNEQKVKLGKKFEKSFSLYPLAIMPNDYTYTGEVTVIEPSANEDSSNGASPAGQPKLSQDEVVNVLREALAGKAPSEMFDAILESSALKSVGTVFGVSLMEAATDESLANVLVENNVLVLTDGKFTVPA